MVLICVYALGINYSCFTEVCLDARYLSAEPVILRKFIFMILAASYRSRVKQNTSFVSHNEHQGVGYENRSAKHEAKLSIHPTPRPREYEGNRLPENQNP
jgi:hypothetical protein